MKKKSLLKKDNLFIRGLYCLVVFFLIITASTIIPEEIQAAGLLGDLNEDQSIDSIDFSLLSRYISGITDDMSMESSDLNSDGYIDSLDIALLRRYLTGSIAVFPGEENEDNTESEKPWYPGNGTRQMENIDRGLVAVQVDDGVFISWRMFGTDPESIAFNLYRDGNKVNNSPITSSTNYHDYNGSSDSTYYIRPVFEGKELGQSMTVSAWQRNYLQVPINPPGSNYSANDASVGDLDGDGQYEIVLKWCPDNAKDNSQSGYTDNVFIDAYELNGTRLWRIDLGRNIRAGAHYTQLMVYDLDGDGKAEVAMRTSDGTVDARGSVIGNANADHSNSGGYILSGPEFLTIFEGITGEALTTVDYAPERGKVSDWGDDYGNRVDRFLAGIAYLDGQRPSLITARGYYEKTMLVAWNWRDGKLKKLWTFDGNNHSGYNGQGNHQLSIGDVDSDGRDEVVYGQMTVDDNGKPLYTSELGHGDAMHLGDLDPNRPGLEVWGCLEGSGGAALRDARNGEVILRWNYNNDTGRALSADIIASSPGEEMWASRSPLFSADGRELEYNPPGPTNFAIWWDGDELRELLDGTTISKYGEGNLLSASGCSSNNGTKSTPTLQADIFGDWREEVIWRSSDNSYLRIYTTTDITERRIYTLMHDPIYRLGIAWQNVAYNQPPHTGFFLGAGMQEPPVPDIYLGEARPGTGDDIGDGSDGYDDNVQFAGSYSIISRMSNRALEVYEHSSENGATITQWDYNGEDNQVWELNYEGNGYYSIISKSSGKALEVYEHSEENGATITQWDYLGGDNQLWRIQEEENGYYSIINKLSGKSLDVFEKSEENGATITQWDYNGGYNQMWRLESE